MAVHVSQLLLRVGTAINKEESEVEMDTVC